MDQLAARRKLLERMREIQSAVLETAEGPAAVTALGTGASGSGYAATPARKAAELSAERRRSLELARINAALRRIDDDEFGYCTNCGGVIQPALLERDPAVAKCSSCATPVGSSAISQRR